MKFTKMVAGGIGLMGIMIATVSLIGIIGSSSINGEYSTLLSQESAINQAAMELEIAMLRARINHKDFIMRLDEKYLTANAEMVAQALKHAEDLNKLMDHSRKFRLERDKPDTLIASIKKYQGQFEVLTAAYVAKGVNEEAGLQGAFRNSVNALASAVDSLSIDGAAMLILKIRKDEKDYLLRLNPKYVQAVADKVGKLIELIDGSSYAADLRPLAESYLADFNSLVAKNIEIATTLKVIRDMLSREIEPLLASIDEVTMKAYTDKQKSVAIQVGFIFVLILTIAGSGIAVGILVGRKLLSVVKKELGAEPDEIGKIASEIARGNVLLNFEEYESFGEYGLYKNMRTMAESVLASVKIAEKIADGDISVEPKIASKDDALGNSLVKMVTALNSVVAGIQHASDQLDSSSGQVSDASQVIAESATEQAATIEEISASMLEIGNSASINAQNAKAVQENALKTEATAKTGAADMENLRKTMDEVLSSSKQVVKIIKVIDDIAFQTNLLALNAAVEAARAGVHGKGFAVVADEVRSLAARSAKAAQETADLITASNSGAQRGAEMTNVTAQAFTQIVEQVGQVGKLIAQTAEGAREQELAVKEINAGLEQLGVSIQNNSATSEQTAAASEEMSAQAVELNGLIRFFKVKESRKVSFISRDRESAPSQKSQMIRLPEPSSYDDDSRILNYGDGPIEY